MSKVPVETVIDPDFIPPETGKKEKQKRRTKADEVSFEEAQSNLTRVFNAIATFLKSEKRYSESDFFEEAKDLSRMAKKYDVVNMILTMLAPVFLILGLVSKAGEMMKSRPKAKKEAKPDEVQTTGDTNNQWSPGFTGGSVSQFPPQ